MKKIICFLCLLVFVVGFTGCSRINNMMEVSKEKIGVEYTVMEGNEIGTDDTHGAVKNYQSNLENNIWTTEFDYMNSTGSQTFTIESDDKLLVNSKVNSGEVWVKITQGDLSLSEIQKVQATNNKEITVDLSQWNDGEIVVWLVVENGENGLITVEQIKNET